MSTELYRNIRETFQETCDSGVLKLANSEYEPIDACDTKGAYATLAKRVTTRGQIALIFGGAFHAAVEANLKGLPINEQVNLAMEYAKERNMSKYEDAKRNYGSLQTLVRMYAADYEMRGKQFKPVFLNDIPAIEKTFELPIGYIWVRDTFGEARELEVYLRGKIDLLSYWAGGDIWVVDHKTTSVMGEQFTADKMRGSQFIFYVMGARALMAGFDPSVKIRGCVINAAAIRSKTFEFKTFDLPFPQWQIDEFKENVLLRAQSWMSSISTSLASCGEDKPNFQTSRSSCVSKYGKCAYFEVCQMMPHIRSGVLYDDTLFRPETHITETYG